MTNEKFNQAVDEIFGFLLGVQKLQMDQMKSNIKTVHEASANKIDSKEIAEQIVDLPVLQEQSREVQFKCEGCTDYKGDHKVLSKDPVVEEGQFGDIWDLSRIQNASDKEQGFDFYHHCPEMQGDLVRLDYSEDKDEHMCPFCSQVFLSKYPPGSLSK